MNHCNYCNAETENPRFCNNSCAAKFNNVCRVRSKASKLKTSNSVKETQQRLGLHPLPPPKLKYCKVKLQECKWCGKTYWWIRKNYCSVECGVTSSTMNATRKYNRKLVNGYWLDSGYEIKVAAWLDSKGIEWTRPKYIPYEDENGKSRKYFPDFYLPTMNVYLDPKNPYLIQTSTFKIQAIQKKVCLFVGSPDEIVARLTGLEPACIH
jgi:hypothetical protein